MSMTNAGPRDLVRTGCERQLGGKSGSLKEVIIMFNISYLKLKFIEVIIIWYLY